MWPFHKKVGPRDVYETVKPALIGRLDALTRGLSERMRIASCYDEEDRQRVANILHMLLEARHRLATLLYSADPLNAENANAIGEALAYIESNYTSPGTLTAIEGQCGIIIDQVADWESHI